MSIIIDPKWTFIDALQAAWKAYPGGVEFGAPNRVRSLERWANVVGRERAVFELDTLLKEYPTFKEASKAFRMSESTLRRIRKNFKAMPSVTTFSSEPSKIVEHIELLKEAKSDIEATDEALKEFLELTSKVGMNPISRLIEFFVQKDVEPIIYENILRQFLEISQKAGINVVSRLVDWITNTAKVEDVIPLLSLSGFSYY